MRSLIIILICIVTIDSFSQESDSIIEIIDPMEIHAKFPGCMDSLWCYDSSIYWNVDSMPDFRFGNDSTLRGRINEFLFSQLKWPSEADCFGTEYIRVVIEKDGSLSNFKL